MRLKKTSAFAGALVCALVLSACSSGSDTAAEEESASAEAAPAASEEAPAASEEAASENPAIAEAQAALAPYLEAPANFPVTEPLETKPTGKRIAVIDCGTPICALFYDLATGASADLGMEVTRVQAGSAADTVAAAFDSVVQGGYDGVFVPALPPTLWENGLTALEDAGIPVVTSAVVGADQTKVDVALSSEKWLSKAGALLADKVVADKGDGANVVFYVTPELSFTTALQASFQEQLAKICPDCTARYVEVPVATFGNKASGIIVDDLAANPDTDQAVFAVGEQAIGLTQALETAGLNVDAILYSPGPEILETIKSGKFATGFGIDLAMIAYMAVDSLARLTTGQEPSAGAAADDMSAQFITADDLPGDVANGWLAYPDFTDRFREVWSSAK